MPEACANFQPRAPAAGLRRRAVAQLATAARGGLERLTRGNLPSGSQRSLGRSLAPRHRHPPRAHRAPRGSTPRNDASAPVLALIAFTGRTSGRRQVAGACSGDGADRPASAASSPCGRRPDPFGSLLSRRHSGSSTSTRARPASCTCAARPTIRWPSNRPAPTGPSASATSALRSVTPVPSTRSIVQVVALGGALLERSELAPGHPHALISRSRWPCDPRVTPVLSGPDEDPPAREHSKSPTTSVSASPCGVPSSAGSWPLLALDAGRVVGTDHLIDVGLGRRRCPLKVDNALQVLVSKLRHSLAPAAAAGRPS